MLTKEKMQEIQDLKLRGLSKAEIIKYYESQGEKPPTSPTLNKHSDMDVVPENPGEKLAKAKAFDLEPFKGAIIAIMQANSQKNLCISSVYDVLAIHFKCNHFARSSRPDSSSILFTFSSGTSSAVDISLGVFF